MSLPVRRGYVEIASGEIHYAMCGTGPPVLLLHQTPRSWDEYRDVLPLIGRRYRAIAMDTIGFGSSSIPPPEDSIECYASAAVAFLDALGIERSAVVGHHTGGAIAVEIAAGWPERVTHLVLSSAPFVDAEDRATYPERPPVDVVDPAEDGSHLTALWQQRMRFYPKDRPDLLHRFVADALKVLERIEEGHRAVHRYVMEQRLGLIVAPTLAIAGTEDPFAHPNLPRFAAAIPGCRTAEIDGGMVPMVDQLPEAFAEAVLDFLDGDPND